MRGQRFRQPGRLLRRNPEFLLYGCLAVLVVVIGVTLNRLTYDQFIGDQRATVAEQVGMLKARVEGDLSSKVELTRGLAAFFQNNPDMTQDHFASIAAELTRDHPEIMDIAAAPDLVVRYVYPRAENKAVLGLNYHTTANQLPAVEQARDSGKVTIAGPVKLVQGGMGFIVRAPVFRSGGVGAAPSFWGIVSTAINIDRFFADNGLLDPTQLITVALRRVDAHGSAGPVFFGDPKIFADNPVVTSITQSAGALQIAATPKGGWPTQLGNANLFRGLYLLAALMLFAAVRYIAILSKRRRLAERRLSEAIDALDDGFALYDQNEKFVICNRKYREFYGTSADLMVPGTSFESIIREGVQRRLFAAAIGREEEWVQERLAAHRSSTSETEQHLHDGRWLKVSDRRTADGGVVGLRVDISALKEATEAAQAANIAKSEFLNVLSHELRTPLTVILGNARVLSHHDGLPQIRALSEMLTASDVDQAMLGRQVTLVLGFLQRLAGKVETSGTHLLNLVNELLDFSKIEAGQMELAIVPLSLTTLLKEICDEVLPVAIKKHLSITLEPGDFRARVDPMRFRQIMVNLIGNAIKFTDSGGIRVSVLSHQEMVEIAVEDSGCGIALHHLDIVFEQFRQVDASAARKAGGTGLGLTITRRLVEMQGGEITVTSVLGKGSIFRFTVPAAPAAHHVTLGRTAERNEEAF